MKSPLVIQNSIMIMRPVIALFSLVAYFNFLDIICASCSGSQSSNSSNTSKWIHSKESPASKNATNQLVELSNEEEFFFEICIPTNTRKNVVTEIDHECEEAYSESKEIIDINDDQIGPSLSSVGKNGTLEYTSSIVVEQEQEGEDKDREQADDEQSIRTLFPRRIGIKNHALNCYASSLISCLYSIPSVHQALFSDFLKSIDEFDKKKNQSLTVALATIFYKMRFAKLTINLETLFAPTVKNVIGWKFKEMECVLEFWMRLSLALPVEIADLFKIEGTGNHFRKLDKVLIKSKDLQSNMILVSPSEDYNTIEKILKNDFVDEDADDYFIEPADQLEYQHVLSDVIDKNASIPSITTFKITNRPKILIFGIKRVYWNAETNSPALNTTPLGFPETLNINEEEYTCVSNIEFDSEREHYFAHNLDLLSDHWYVHDDRQVQRIPDTAAAFSNLSGRFATNSCMVFYVKKSSIDEYMNDLTKIEIPTEVLAKLAPKIKNPVSARSEKLPSKRRRVKEQQQEEHEQDQEHEQEQEVSDEEEVKKKRVRRQKKYPEYVDSQKENFEVEIEEPVKLTKEQRKPKSIESTPSSFKKFSKKQKDTINNSPNEPVSTACESENDIIATPEVAESVAAVTQSIVEKPLAVPETENSKTADTRLTRLYCLFIDNPRITYLEHVLVSLSCNPAIIKVLFEEAKTKSPSDLIFKLSVVILKIISGHSNISIAALSDELKQNHNFTFRDIQGTWMDLARLLPEKISPIPHFKLVKYVKDEPVEMFTEANGDHVKLKPHKIKLYPNNINVNGIFYDSVDSESSDITLRSIFKSEGIVLPIGVNRFHHDPERGVAFDDAPLCINSYDRTINSFIGFDPKRQEIFSVHWNSPNPSKIILFYKNVPREIPIHDELLETIQLTLRHRSELIMFSRPEDQMKDMPTLSDVPRILLNELNS